MIDWRRVRPALVPVLRRLPEVRVDTGRMRYQEMAYVESELAPGSSEMDREPLFVEGLAERAPVQGVGPFLVGYSKESIRNGFFRWMRPTVRKRPVYIEAAKILGYRPLRG